MESSHERPALRPLRLPDVTPRLAKSRTPRGTDTPPAQALLNALEARAAEIEADRAAAIERGDATAARSLHDRRAVLDGRISELRAGVLRSAS